MVSLQELEYNFFFLADVRLCKLYNLMKKERNHKLNIWNFKTLKLKEELYNQIG